MVVNPRDYITSIIIFTLIVGCVVAILAEFKADDPTFGDESPQFQTFNATFNKYDEISSQVSGWQNNVENVSQDNSALGVWDSLISGGWSMLSLLGKSTSFMAGVFTGVSSLFGLPAWITTLLYMLVIVMIIFAIYSAIFRKDV